MCLCCLTGEREGKRRDGEAKREAEMKPVIRDGHPAQLYSAQLDQEAIQLSIQLDFEKLSSSARQLSS